MNILLHICCAPCAIYAVEAMRREGHHVGGLFYNPNIHPYAEYEHRSEAVEGYANRIGIDVAYGEYEIEKFFGNITFDEAGIKNRCPSCWRMRMEAVVKFAGSRGYEAFTTTLLGSPYQGHDTIKRICADISSKTGIIFYYKDFRAGFRDAHAKAKTDGIYCQKYCGCLFSERERAGKIKNQIQKIKNTNQKSKIYST